MAYTQDDLNRIKAAIASGERQVTIGSQSVTYRSISDLIRARDEIQTDLNAQAAASSPKPKIARLFMASRGYHARGR